MKNSSRRQQVLRGTLLLTIASFVAKLLSAVYRIPFQNMVGNIGFYVYQQIYPIYGIGMTFALTGLPVFISKLVVDTKDSRDRVALAMKIQNILIVVCLTVFCILQFAAGLIALKMDDPKLAPVIQSVSWMFLFIPFLSTWRGYFQGKMEMRPTAYSQVIEQVVRVSTILLVGYWAVKSVASPYKMGQLAMLSAPIAGFCALLFVMIWVRRHSFPVNWRRHQSTIQNRLLIKRILLEGGTLCLVSAVMLLLQLADSFSVVAGLQSFGYSLSEAQNIKGIYDRSQTLVQLGQVLSIASATAVLPGLVLANKHHQDVTFRHVAATNLRTNLAISLAMSVGLFGLMPQINRLLFASSELNLTISLYCFSIILTSILMTYNVILQSKDNYLKTMIAIIAGFLFKILVNHWFVSLMGIIGASTATLLSLVVMVVLMNVLSRKELAQLISFKQVSKLVIVLIAMLIVVELIVLGMSMLDLTINPRIEALIVAGVAIPLGVVMFFGGCVVLKVFTIREWLAIPMVGKFLKIKGVTTHENR
ncbi:oligosaccharide flippase family protein [Lentilactobacillus otakiensis]|nr:oligosaccharide flippase family protein [Lentilactobacillus otakiensis]MBZ3776072.1 oligosaccharide flippase family protein [Lentilactobacillus otakiensis]MDV3519147.1 oligosaccharide flippase family protein [Lentilactobacillus otakiensis]